MTHCRTKSSKESPWQQVAAGLPRLKFHVRSTRNKHFPNTSRELPGGQIRHPTTGWPAGCKSISKKESWLLQEKIKSAQKISLKLILYIYSFEWQTVLSQINTAGVCRRREVLFITLFSHSLFKESLLCSHIFFSSTICCSLASLTTCDSRTRVWTVKNGKKTNNHSRPLGFFSAGNRYNQFMPVFQLTWLSDGFWLLNI